MRRKPTKRDLAAEIDDVRSRAARLGLRLAGDKLDAILPATRCTKAEREKAEELAAAAGISLSEHIRRRAITP
ncbi:MAG TPA: hypothetical protein VNH17_16835 [Streptosporangiaceae bacterium]|nr:hypothetical protein [Streptosporangiaceae bacterium]